MLAKKILTFQIFLDDCSLLLRQNHPQKWCKVGASVVDRKEFLALIIQYEIKIFFNLTRELHSEGMTTVILISKHWLNDQLNLLQQNSFTKQLLKMALPLIFTLIVGKTK